VYYKIRITKTQLALKLKRKSQLAQRGGGAREGGGGEGARGARGVGRSGRDDIGE
jgi:hypothetical protein